MPLVSDKHSNGRFATRPYAEAGSCIGLLEDQEGTFGLGVSQEALDITVLTGCSVQLLFVDDDPLQETFFHQAVKRAHDKKKFAFWIQYLMDFLGTAWTNRIDDLEKFKFLISYPDVVFISRHGWFMI